MSFEEGLRDNAAMLGTIGAAAHLKNQSFQNKVLLEQKELLKEQAEAEKQKLRTEKEKLQVERRRLQVEEERVKNEKEYRIRIEKLERLKKVSIKEVRKTLASAKVSIDRLEKEFNKF